MTAARSGSTFTYFIESRAWRGADGRCYSTDAGLEGRNWASELPEHVDVRLALRVDDRPGQAQGAAIAGEIIALPYYVGVRSMIRRLPALVRAVDSTVEQSDVVVAKLPGLIGTLAVARARRARKPIAVMVVGDIWDVLRAGVAGTVGRILAPLAVVITRHAVRTGDVARYVTERALQRRYPPRAGVKAIACSDVQPDFSDERMTRASVRGRVIAVGSQEQLYKGHHVAIRSLAMIVASHPEAQLELVGSGRYQPRLRVLASELGVGEHVHFIGQVADRQALSALLDQAELFIMPSIVDGLPRALVEAMARGLPCIGSDVGGIPELLPDFALTPTGDVEALARLMKQALAEREFRERLRMAAVDSVQRFRPEALNLRRQEWTEAVEALAMHRSRV